jgi:hypothetical protein
MSTRAKELSVAQYDQIPAAWREEFSRRAALACDSGLYKKGVSCCPGSPRLHQAVGPASSNAAELTTKLEMLDCRCGIDAGDWTGPDLGQRNLHVLEGPGPSFTDRGVKHIKSDMGPCSKHP